LGNALGLLCFYLFVLHRFNIVSNRWKRFHNLVESYVQKKQLSTEYSVVRGRNGTPGIGCTFDIEKSAVLYWKLAGTVSKGACMTTLRIAAVFATCLPRGQGVRPGARIDQSS
jgi:hypothetical protein